MPGIAARGAEILAEGEGDDCVTNTYQLIGKFLTLRGPDIDGHEVGTQAKTKQLRYYTVIGNKSRRSWNSLGDLAIPASEMNTYAVECASPAFPYSRSGDTVSSWSCFLVEAALVCRASYHAQQSFRLFCC